MSTKVALHPDDIVEHGPWVEGCKNCKDLRASGEVGLASYLLVVAEHFEDQHGIVLVGADRKAP